MRSFLLHHGRHAVVAVACLAGLAATPAQAITVALGTITSPGSVSISNSGLSGPVADSFSFSIGAGSSFSFSGLLETPMSNRFWIDDLDATLLRSGSPVAEGDSQQMATPFPWTTVAFSAVTLSAGDYVLNVFGNATSAFPGPTSTYGGILSFAPVTPVPEPATLALMLTGLAGLGAWAMRRQRKPD